MHSLVKERQSVCMCRYLFGQAVCVLDAVRQALGEGGAADLTE